MSGNNVCLEVKNISKSFPGVKALDSISLDLREGEVLGFLGENGAGKSTLIKILTGTYSKDSGDIYIDGQLVHIKSPAEGKAIGIRAIYQELNTLDKLTVAENIFVGELPKDKRFKIINWKEMYEEASGILEKLKVNLNPKTILEDCTIAQKQMVEIARAIHKKAKILIMDEPTAALGEKDVVLLFNTIKELKKSGVAIIYISHRFSEIFEITDRVAVFRDGKLVGVMNTNETDRDTLVKMMVGRELSEMYPKTRIPIGEVVLEVNNYSSKHYFQNIDFVLKKGEILGFFGLLGSGRSHLLNALMGAFPKDSGTLKINGKDVNINNPKLARDNSIGLVPISRKEEGIILSMNVKNNITLTNIEKLGNGIVLNKMVENTEAEKWVKNINIKTPGLETIVDNLSGGNQQKVVVAKWLESNSKILLLDEPTRGIDVGAKVEIYKLMERLCASGVAIIMSSTELSEILGIADRIIVMSEGRITAEYNQNEANKENLLHAASK